MTKDTSKFYKSVPRESVRVVTKLCKLLHVIDTKRHDQNKTKIKHCSSAVTVDENVSENGCIYLARFAKTSPLGFRLKPGIAQLQASVAA